MINILMIEDDPDIADLLSEFLLQYNMIVTNYEDPELGLSALNFKKYDLIILDLSLPGLDGTEVCKLIRKKSQIPIIISSARSDMKDKSLCYNNGADDYIPKPYDSEELLLRIKALLKRSQSPEIISSKKEIKPFSFSREKFEIYKNGEVLNFTMAEYYILEYMIKRSGFPLQREEILSEINSIKYESSTRSIDVLIGRIRHKIESNPKEPQYIYSIRGVGYKFVNK